MAIDDPINAAQKIMDAEERESNPITDPLLALASNLFPWVDILGSYREIERNSRQELFLKTVAKELKALILRFDDLEEKQKRFLHTDFCALVLDGISKAETVRATDRIVRIAKIVASAAFVHSQLDMDDTEELMRVAASITAIEVEFLRQMTLMPNSRHVGGIASIEEANDDWKDYNPKISGVDLSEYQSIGLKLQSFGLIESVERRPMKLGPDVSPFIASSARYCYNRSAGFTLATGLSFHSQAHN